MRVALPIDPFIHEIRERVRESRAAIITAAPGAGKTTRVPPALADDGPVIVLQPRRIAARSLARRIADEQGWTIGEEVGWHVRFERRFTTRTRVLLATEGILTARLQQDPLLTDFRSVILDEFHERSVHADLGIAFAKQAWLARQELRLVIMSATLDAARVSTYLDGCPVIDVPGTLHPLEVRYAPGLTMGEAIDSCLRESSGQVLCFLPGAPEIARAHRELTASWSAAAGRRDDAPEIVELHGSLDAPGQDAAIAGAPHRRVILATNIAETSLTVPGVSSVVDTGLHKVARYDPDRGIDSLETERISRDAAEQRAGRAGRLGPGFVVRLWHHAARLRSHREPEISRVDLTGTILEILSWGGDPRTFDWFDRPPAEAIDAAFGLLERIGATETGRLTDHGRRMQRLPISPRLSAILIAAGGNEKAALACALLSERHYQPDQSVGQSATTSDLLDWVERRDLPSHVIRVAETLKSLAVERGEPSRGKTDDQAGFRRALLAGYPDRVARRRAPGSPRVLLESGHGAVIGPESNVRSGEFLIALDVTAGRRGEGSEARIRMASLVEREWLPITETRLEHAFDPEAGVVRAVSRGYYGAIVLTERPLPPDPAEAERLLVDTYLARGLSADDWQLVRRLRFAGMDADPRTLAERAARRSHRLRDLDLQTAVDGDERRRLERLAPAAVNIPSGRSARLEYLDDGSVIASVKVQELFGLADTPRIGPRREPVILSLLAPNGRPVQTTRDLRSFWERTYPEVRKELRGRYPRHPWPENPWTAAPTSRTTRRGVK
jgi:ATP-dependent RNA helicase HrpB